MTDSAVLRSKAEDVARVLHEAGFEALFAGGCVRDGLLGHEPKDYDIATNARPEQVQALFDRSVAVGKAFGVICVLCGEDSFEVATFRTDEDYADGRHPGRVRYSTAEEDARRRDFSINAMFLDPRDGRVIDYAGGREDLAARIVRAVGDPAQRFAEDHLRLLRAVRFAATFDFRIEPRTLEAVREMAPLITQVSTERIEQELTRILLDSSRAGDALGLLHDAGLLVHILPEVHRMIGQEQPEQFHPEGDVFTHTVLMLNAIGARDKILAYSALLHDVGKPATLREGLGADGVPRLRFDRHAEAGAAMARDILSRLHMPRREIEQVVVVIANHMGFMNVQQMRRSTLRQFMGRPTFSIELELHRLDCLASHQKMDNYEFLVAARQAFAEEPILPDPWVSGHDVMALGVSEGPEVGRCLALAYEAQTEERFGDRAELLAWLATQVAP